MDWLRLETRDRVFSTGYGDFYSGLVAIRLG
jgi:hypothetical protein